MMRGASVTRMMRGNAMSGVEIYELIGATAGDIALLWWVLVYWRDHRKA